MDTMEDEKDFVINYEIEKALDINQIIADSIELNNVKYSLESKGNHIKSTGQMIIYCQAELKKGRTKEELLTELKAEV